MTRVIDLRMFVKAITVVIFLVICIVEVAPTLTVVDTCDLNNPPTGCPTGNHH